MREIKMLNNGLYKIFSLVRKSFTAVKIMINRSLSYLSIANSLMIGVLFLTSLQQRGININIPVLMPFIIVSTLILLVVVGWIDDKLGMHNEENRITSSKNPYTLEMIERLKRIEEKLDKKKKDNINK
jgi:hypothetical protein